MQMEEIGLKCHNSIKLFRDHTCPFDHLFQQGLNGPSETDYIEEKHIHKTPMPTR